MTEPIKYRPVLRKREVDPRHLLLWPNNPRFIETIGKQDTRDANDTGVQNLIREELGRAQHKLEDLKKSIKANGWLPVDNIFVRCEKFSDGDDEQDKYIVLEGNRRVAALQDIISKLLPPDPLLDAIKKITVFEIEGDHDSAEIKAQVDYLLGVRHHGSLKQWSAFAQASDVYRTYLGATQDEDDNFEWNDDTIKSVAAQMAITEKQCSERIETFRAMKQLDSHEPIRSAGGIEGSTYSLVRDAFSRKDPGLRDYFKYDKEDGFSEEALSRLEKLCHFSKPGKVRKNSPISSPAELRSFEQIFKDDGLKPELRKKMIEEVESGVKPSTAYAPRAQELARVRWDQWLLQAHGILADVTMKDVGVRSPHQKELIERLSAVLKELESHTAPGEAS